MLAGLPRPSPRVTPVSSPITESLEVQQPEGEPPSRLTVQDVAKDLLLTTSEESPLYTPITPSFAQQRPAASANKPASSSSARDSRDATTRFLSTSLQTQEELSSQLAAMASQLKANSLRFTDALVKDKAVLEGAEEKLQGNLTKMQKERGRLGVLRGKSGSTTWLVLGSLVVVMIAWVVTFLLIRIT